jgi:hypothetical protein
MHLEAPIFRYRWLKMAILFELGRNSPPWSDPVPGSSTSTSALMGRHCQSANMWPSRPNLPVDPTGGTPLFALALPLASGIAASSPCRKWLPQLRASHHARGMIGKFSGPPFAIASFTSDRSDRTDNCNAHRLCSGAALNISKGGHACSPSSFAWAGFPRWRGYGQE